MYKDPVKKEEILEKEKETQPQTTKPEGSNWNTSTPPGYREEM